MRNFPLNCYRWQNGIGIVCRVCVQLVNGLRLLWDVENAVPYVELGFRRQSGDIDIYPEGGYEREMDYVSGTFPPKTMNELEIQYHSSEGVWAE